MVNQDELYDLNKISDEWFRSHFIYAADIVTEWLEKAKPVTKSTILDFGCGDGIMSLGLALRKHAKMVHGIDLHDSFSYLPETAMKQINLATLPNNIQHHRIQPGESIGKLKSIDVVYSWSVFEHIDRNLLPGIARDIFSTLPSGGSFFLQVEPLYHSPHGSHLGGVLRQPWIHLLVNQEELVELVMKSDLEKISGDHKNKTFDVCSSDDFKSYLIREYGTLNKINHGELTDIFVDAGFFIQEKWLGQTNSIPPAALLEKHSKEDLITAEVRVLFKKK
jgi:hypothetical protein